MNHRSSTANLREFRCPRCHSLLYKYKIHPTYIELETKCYADNEFSTLIIELRPLFEIWTQKNKNNKGRINDKK